jgi:hypothetical protein
MMQLVITTSSTGFSLEGILEADGVVQADDGAVGYWHLAGTHQVDAVVVRGRPY